MKRKPALFYFVAFLLVAVVVLMLFNNRDSWPKEKKEKEKEETETPSKLNVSIVTAPDDTVRNPYAPPVRHFPKNQYAQIGYLELSEQKVPLFGKPCPTQRRNWLYYAVPRGGIKLPLEVKGRNCTVAPGCDELMSGDDVKVDGRSYIVRLYESDMYEYDPFLE